MAIAATNMSSQDDRENSNNYNNNKDDDHEHDLVMPGFRFHPTEEELIEFYLRRKVEGKRFSVELITFLDLYRYDPWELPGMTPSILLISLALILLLSFVLSLLTLFRFHFLIPSILFFESYSSNLTPLKVYNNMFLPKSL